MSSMFRVARPSARVSGTGPAAGPAVHEIDTEVFVNMRSGDPVLVLCLSRKTSEDETDIG